jgi:glycosyltransferase involved in cell wall biosynthesis
MSLSVLTIVKDRSAHLAQLIEGLRRSTHFPDELIIVDMASTPPITAQQAPFPIQILRLDGPGLPLAAARNAAARAARGDKLLFLDVDCIPMRALTSAITQCLTDHNALICADIRYLGPDDARGEWKQAECGERIMQVCSGRWHLVYIARDLLIWAGLTKLLPAMAGKIPTSVSARVRQACPYYSWAALVPFISITTFSTPRSSI